MCGFVMTLMTKRIAIIFGAPGAVGRAAPHSDIHMNALPVHILKVIAIAHSYADCTRSSHIILKA